MIGVILYVSGFMKLLLGVGILIYSFDVNLVWVACVAFLLIGDGIVSLKAVVNWL